MVATGPTPGSTPMAVPMTAPIRHQNRFWSVTATDKPEREIGEECPYLHVKLFGRIGIGMPRP